MVVRIEQIREGGLTLTEPVSQKLLTEALGGVGGVATEDTRGDTGFRPVAPADGQVTLQKIGAKGAEDVLVRGKYTVKVAAPCKRCLEDVQLDVPVEFALNLVRKKPARVEDEDDDELGDGRPAEDGDGGDRGGTFSLDETDQETFDGRTIDLDPILREQVLLALPMHAVCREDCKGLCSICGQNLNEKKCGCDPKGIDPRLAPLKNIKLSN